MVKDLDEPDLWPCVEVRHTTPPRRRSYHSAADKMAGSSSRHRHDAELLRRRLDTVEDARQDGYRWEDVWKVPQEDLKEPPCP